MDLLTFADRPSSSPLIERVWRAQSHRGGPFRSMAEGNLELVFTRLPGITRVTLRGPVTQPSIVQCPADGEWVAIRFSLGTYLPGVPAARLLNHNSIDLPLSRARRFWFAGERWEIPGPDDAESFVKRLAAHGAIGRDPAVAAALAGDDHALTLRSVQRHFLQATGITHALFRQIGRARQAVNLLRAGSSILDVVHQAGYFDQAHLTRSLKRLIGHTPGQILSDPVQLSFLYKTEGTVAV